jgi:hypothetical protein
MPGNSTRPVARLNRETTQQALILRTANVDARRLTSKTRRRAKQANEAAALAQADADTAQETADAAQIDATQALTDAATAQSTADGKTSLLTASTISTDADETFTATASNSLIIHDGVLTVDRLITLDPATDKWQARFIRTGADAFNLSIGGLKNLTTGTWCDAYYNGTSWVLTASGTL